MISSRSFILNALFGSCLLLPALNGCVFNEKKSNTIENPIIETLISSSESWSGDKYYYPEGQAEMSLIRITAPVGFRTPVHTHSQPGVAYVIKGVLECVVSADKTLLSKAGDSFPTSFGNTPHYCENVGEENAVLLLSYAGVVGTPLTDPY
mgnify:CR=1 FL=1